MRHTRLWLPVILLSSALFIAGCSPSSSTAPATPAGKATSAAPARPAWQQDWDDTLARARKEGRLIAVNGFGGETRVAVGEAFKQKYGIDVEFVTATGSQLITKVLTERQAGIYQADVGLHGTTSQSLFRDAGVLDPVDPLLVLPDVVDGKLWRGGQIAFMDSQKQILMYLQRASVAMMVNTELVKEGEVTSYADLANPRWKGKIGVLDPSVSGPGTQFFFNVMLFMGLDFARDLVKQDLAILSSGRQQVEGLARGKYAIIGTPYPDMQNEFTKLGAPIKVILPKEGTSVAAATGALGLINRAPHPNTAKIFINWLLTAEGQTLMSKLAGDGSRRLDVPQDWVSPMLRIQPGYRYIESDTEEMLAKKREVLVISKEAWQIKK